MTKSIPADPIMFTGITDCLAIAVENAVIEWGDTLDSFFEKFLASGLADSFSNQEPFVTTGCTGEELVTMVNERVGGLPQTVRVHSSLVSINRSIDIIVFRGFPQSGFLFFPGNRLQTLTNRQIKALDRRFL